jgi:hypothetical protein
MRSDLTRESLSRGCGTGCRKSRKAKRWPNGRCISRMVLPRTATSTLSMGDSAPGNRVDTDGETRSGHGYGH